MYRESCGMAKAWEATLRRTQAAAKKRAHSIFSSMSVTHVNEEFDDEGGTQHHQFDRQMYGDCEGQEVEKILPNGDYYNGRWYDDCPHGHGKYLWTDGCMYVGEWFRGQAIGKGRFSWPSGATYDGEFKSGYMDGKGTYAGTNGETYKGFWVMNVKHGQGRMNYESGDYYEGEWRHGVQEGHGKQYWSSGRIEYEGEWKEGVMCGKGTMTWADNGNQFEGVWADGLPCGEGAFRWQNGSYYEGSWSKDPTEQIGFYYPSEEATDWDPQLLFDDISKHAFVCSVDKIPIYPSQKRLATWRSSKGLDPRVRPGRLSVDSRINANGGERLYGWDADGSFSSDGNARNSVSGRDGDLEGLNLEHLAHRMMSPARPLRIPKAGRKQGETITRGHKNFDLMLNLQLGIRHAVGKQGPPTSLDLKASAFDPKDKHWTKFPSEGSKYTPPHNSIEFRWKDYCPLVFRALRKLFKVDAADYMLSICGNDALRELSSPGKSGSFFYLSNDDRYMIKTLKKAEAKVLIRMLSAYYNHVRAYENTLVTKFFGLHCVKLTGPAQKKVRFIVMGNLLCTEYTIHRRFDLKGSSLGRSTAKAEDLLDASTILKDLDLNFIFRLQKSWFQDFCRQVDRDCEFLENERIMDYSMLVGIHFRESSKAGDLVPSGSRTPVGQIPIHDRTSYKYMSLRRGSHLVPLAGNDEGDNDGGPRLSRVDMDQLLVDPAWWASIRLGTNMPARVERTIRRNDGETVHTMEPTGEFYEVVMFFGIIDILQDYDISKKLEHAYKAMHHDPTSISAVDPKLYSKRFRDFIYRIYAEDE